MKPMSTLTQWAMLLLVTFTFVSNISATEEYCPENADLFSIHCPYDVTVSCTDEIWDLSIYGNANYHDYTGWHDAGTPVEHYYLNSCNSGYITRTWTVEDYNWNLHTCTQTITVSGGSNPFGYDDIWWPHNYIELEGCNPSTHPSHMPNGYGWPTYAWQECSHVGVSYRDQVFVVNDGCKKIKRKWTVKDWCQNGSSGEWYYWQTIKIMGGEAPDVSCEELVEADSYNCQDKYVEIPPIHVYGDQCGDDYHVTNNSPYADNNGPDISGTYPIGTTYVKYLVQYGCGKSKTCTTRVIVKDKKGPTVYCIGQLTVALMGVDADNDGVPEDGMVEIWAKDLDRGSAASCNGHNVQFSFSEDVTDKFKVFTCADVGLNEVNMYVTDNYGRQSYCIVTVDVQNNGANIPDCEPVVDDEEEDPTGDDQDSTYYQGLSLAGAVMDMEVSPYEGAIFTLTNANPVVTYEATIDTTIEMTTDSFYNQGGVLIYFYEIDSIYSVTIDTIISNTTYESISDEDGHFEFIEIADSTASFTLAANIKNEEPFSGIGKEDLNLLLDYIIGNAEFTTLGQFVAADIDNNKKVDFDDLKILLDFLSGNENDVLSYEWKVIENAKDDMPLEKAFNEMKPEMSIDMAGVDHMDIGFTAVKIGDLTQEEDVPTLTQADLGQVAQVLTTDELNLIADITEIEVRSVATQPIANSAVVTPNPFLDVLNIQYQDAQSGSVILEIVDVKGQKLYTKNLSTTIGNNDIKVDMAAYKNTGILIYRIIDGAELISGKVIRL